MPPIRLGGAHRSATRYYAITYFTAVISNRRSEESGAQTKSLLISA